MVKNIFVKMYFDYAGYLFRFFPNLLSFLPPKTIIVEATNMCMLKCPACVTVNSSQRAKEVMQFETFKFLLDSIDWRITRINFSFSGEPLLNPYIFRMVKYAREKDINSIIETNGVLLDGLTTELLDSGLHKLNIAFDGVDQESIAKYRRGIKLDSLLGGIKKLSAEKIKRKQKFPEIHLQFIVMRHNQHLINAVIEMSKQLGIEYVDFKSMILSGGSGLSKEAMAQIANEYLPDLKAFLRYELKDGQWQLKKGRRQFCTHALSDVVIMLNGDVTVCTMDVQGKLVLGNIFKSPLRQIWGSKAYTDIRKKILTRELDVCKECGYLLNDFRVIPTKEGLK